MKCWGFLIYFQFTLKSAVFFFIENRPCMSTSIIHLTCHHQIRFVLAPCGKSLHRLCLPNSTPMPMPMPSLCCPMSVTPRPTERLSPCSSLVPHFQTPAIWRCQQSLPRLVIWSRHGHILVDCAHRPLEVGSAAVH